MSNTDYNGFSNYETWNIILWISNDEGIYNNIVDALRATLNLCDGDWENVSHTDVRQMVIEAFGMSIRTPDGVVFHDSRIAWDEISDSLAEIASSENLMA